LSPENQTPSMSPLSEAELRMSAPLSFERRAVAALASLYAFRMLGLFMVLPILTLYGDDYEGSTPLLIGVALGAYGFSQSLLQIAFGSLSDRWGRKPVIAAGLLIFALGSVVAALADSMWGLILGRCLQGCGAVASVIMALVADLTSEENRTKAMASIGASIGLSFSLALVLGPLVSQWGGLSAVFWLTAALALVGLLVLWRWVPTPEVSNRHREAGAVPELWGTVLRNPELRRLNVGIFVLHFVLMACFMVLPGILENTLDLSRDIHWKIYLPLLLLAFVAMVPLMIMAEARRKIKPVFIFAVALLGVMIALMGLWQDRLWLCIGALFFFFMAFNLLEAMLPSLMSKVAPAGAKGTAMGVYSTCQFLGAFLGGSISGYLIEYHGTEAVFKCAFVLVVLWLLAAISMRPPRFLTSVQVPLVGVRLDQAVVKLELLPGVAEVVLIREEACAYLKVDTTLFDRVALESIDWERA